MVLYFMLFIILISSLYTGTHLYLYKSIISDLPINKSSRLYLRLFFWSAAVLFLIAEFSVRHPMPAFIRPFIYICTLWGGVLVMAVCLFILKDILKIFFHSENFKKNAGICTIVLLFVLSVYSAYNGARFPKLKEVLLRFEKLPEKFSGFTIIHLTDMHLNYLITNRWLKKIVDKVNAQNADLVVITGDLIDSGFCNTDKFSEILKNIHSKYGTYAVTGNHEFYTGIGKFMTFAKKSNLTVLRNEKIDITNHITLIGIDDAEFRRFSDENDVLESLLKNIDPKKLNILLYHRPTNFEKAANLGIDLQLSGHTHGGQIFPANFIVGLLYRYSAGLYKYGKSYIHTSVGTGNWGPQMRLLSRTEIVKVVLSN